MVLIPETFIAFSQEFLPAEDWEISIGVSLLTPNGVVSIFLSASLTQSSKLFSNPISKVSPYNA